MGSQLIGRAFLNVCDTFSNGRKISTNTPQGWRLTLKTLSDSPTHQKSSNYAQTNPALRGKWKIYSKLHHQQTFHVGHLEELGNIFPHIKPSRGALRSSVREAYSNQIPCAIDSSSRWRAG